MGIEFKYPFMLLLIIPSLLLVFLFIRTAKGSRENRKGAAVMRAVVFILLAFALAVPSIRLPAPGKPVVFIADRSASVQGREGELLDFIDAGIQSKEKEDSYAVISAGETAAAESSLAGMKGEFREFSTDTGKGETNLEAGIQLASTLMPQETPGRIVLLSDGRETAGSSREAAKLLKNRGIELDYVLLDSSRKEDMSISSLNVPPALYEGEEASITIAIDSNSAKEADLRLSVNSREVLKERITVKEGKNVYTFKHKMDETGLSAIKAEISAEGDGFIENNALQSAVNIKGTPRVLIVEQEKSQLETILDGSGLLADSIVPEKLPNSLSGFLPYQSIIFNNVPATVVSENQMILIEKAVKEFGSGFIMAGGENSFGLGGYFKTPIEKLLPVSMDIKGKKEMPSLGLMIVMDRSGSMAGNKLELAKEAAARSVELLREKDTLGFIAFDDRPWVIVETGPLDNKKDAVDKIASVTPGGGTEIFTSLEKAYEELEDLKLQRKHIILLTDGQSARSADYESMIETGKEKNITLSAVALGSDADRNLLEELAELGAGRFYDVTDSSVIPSILSRETVMATRTYIEDKPFYPSLQPYPEWGDFFAGGIPQMNAYIASEAKQGAKVPLLSEKEDPVLAEWQYGIGHTIAFTSDISGKWSGDWARWEKWPQFMNKLASISLPKYESEAYSISVRRENEETVVLLEGNSKAALPADIAVVSDKGEKVDASTKLAAPGKYEIKMPSEPGMFYVNISQQTLTGETRTYKTGFTLPYSEEYLLQKQNEGLLKEISALTGGKRLEEGKEAFRPLKAGNFEKASISEWLLLAAFLLFFAEIAARRFGLKLIPERQKAKKAAGSDKSRLLEKTASARRRAADREKGVQVPESRVEKAESAGRQAEARKPKGRSGAPSVSPDEREERMKRLLEAKKRKS
ncbi:VWA domain-containing protein [Bacillus infantis]|uniref:VWA domain-containing protein n=1 Tax=Bacillus infantis TaxID=324767 RepID=UPI001CD56550|nr:VWA domain-containing protein [Bacillus infantis]MCA1040745.1 VWA domain-containing protein [Bacillus infantis]